MSTGPLIAKTLDQVEQFLSSEEEKGVLENVKVLGIIYELKELKPEFDTLLKLGKEVTTGRIEFVILTNRSEIRKAKLKYGVSEGGGRLGGSVPVV
jgi:hypothetical protein